MKNEVVIILDTESETPLQIGKMELEAPKDPEKLAETISLDFRTVAEATIVLIKELERMGIQNHVDSVRYIVEAIETEFPGTFTVSE